MSELAYIIKRDDAELVNNYLKHRITAYGYITPILYSIGHKLHYSLSLPEYEDECVITFTDEEAKDWRNFVKLACEVKDG